MASRDITQAYPQSHNSLWREIYVHLPAELKEQFPPGTILRIMKPLYGIAEAGVHWFATYQAHHLTALNMRTSPYDSCLLITKLDAGTEFVIVGLQTDNTLYLATTAFLEHEQCAIDAAKFNAKPRVTMSRGQSEAFNGASITVDLDSSVTIHQKGQSDKLAFVTDPTSYLEQRARGAYIASLCQPVPA